MWPFRRAKQRDNRGEHPSALWISNIRMESGYHETDKLTPDGLLCGYAHSDSEEGFELTYTVEPGVQVAAEIFARLATEPFSTLADNYSDPGIDDGFTLQIRWRLEGQEKLIWLCNVTHPLLTPLVEELWRYAPASARRSYPVLPSIDEVGVRG